jgi:glucose-6-phosphate isomerase
MDFSDQVISGAYKGLGETTITDIVNIGIGGSDLGPSMVSESLSHYKTRLNVHFVNNVDGDQIHEVLQKLSPKQTLFIVVSKTFTTIETITNARIAKQWFSANINDDDISKNFIAVSSNTKAVKEFGIHDSNIFPMWDWVGGRFSLWGSVGLSINLSIGSKNFNDLLIGANEMDDHFKLEPLTKNIPLLAACISIWYNNFYNYETHAVIPYNQNMKSFSAYLQQASMESNGKQTSRNGELINYQSGSIIWGQVGTNAQHSFFQLIHQGTKIVPCDFIGFSNPLNNNVKSHQILMANFFAQTKALMIGNKDDYTHKYFTGNRPTNTILIKKLTPKNLGSLIALYEHKIFSVGVILNLFSFDQFGVELGKKLANDILKDIKQKSSASNDSSTQNLLNKFFDSI